MQRTTDTQPLDPAGEDPLDDVVATCLESGADDLESAVARACDAHPGSADEIRRRIELLRKVGLLRPTSVDEDDRFPEQLGEFRLLERLGGGGMGVVFRARQGTLGREVALKLIRPEHLYFPRARERFRRETEACGRLQHPGIVPVYTVGESNGIPFFAMELIGGSTLADALHELRGHEAELLRGTDLEQALRRCAPAWSKWNESVVASAFDGAYGDNIVRLVIQVADALHHAHSRDVLHRDVKPSNIAVTPQGRALLFDFGLASLAQGAGRSTLTRGEIGSLYYMSPEQIRGAPGELDRRSDVYALGVTLYEMLAMRVPFAEREPNDTRRAILEGAARPLRSLNRAVSRDLELVCAKAMDRDATRRYEDAAAFARDLRNVLEHRPIVARPASTTLQARRWIQRHKLATTLLTAAIALPSALYFQKSVHVRQLDRALGDANNQRTAAQREARDASAANEFLIKLFSEVDPANARGRELSARDMLDEGAKRLETQLADQPLVRARLLNSIGQSYASLGDWKNAEATLDRARELLEQAGAAESSTMADNLVALADLERDLGRPGAVEHARRALEMRLALPPEYEDQLTDTYLAYAMALTDAGQYDDADAVYRKAIAHIDRLEGDTRRMRATVLINFAALQMVRREPEPALASAREGIELWRATDPEPGPATTAGLNVIAGSLVALRRFDEARPIFDEMLNEEHRLTGDSARYAAMLTAKSFLELDTDHVAEAVALLERASAMFAELTLPTQSEAMVCRSALAAAYERSRRWRDAIDVYQQLVSVIEADAGPQDLHALMDHVKVALCYEALAEWPAAEEEVTTVLERCAEAQTDSDDGWEIHAAAHLAIYLARRGDVAGAGELVKRAQGLVGNQGLKSAANAWTQLAAGIVTQVAGDAQRASAEFEPLAQLERGPKFGEATPAIARAHLACVLASSDATRARELAARARAELEHDLGSEHPETRALVEFIDALQ